MPSLPFKPAKIYIDRDVAELSYTQKILQKFSGIEVVEIEDRKILKKPVEMTGAKKNLLLTRLRADPLKEFHAMTQSSRRPYFALNLVSNCHLECTYCILQSFLANNPLITVYTNLDEILERLQLQIKDLPPGSIIGTGKISDSLALEPLTEFHQHLIPFFAKQDKVRLELKTKADCIDSLLDLSHEGKTVISWSMNPEQVIEREEYKTASFKERLSAAKKAAASKYPVAFHFDPMIVHKNWKENYKNSVQEIFRHLQADQIAWISLGLLRFPHKQMKIMKKRFPKNDLIFKQMTSSSLSFMHYPDDLREEIHQWMEENLFNWIEKGKVYRCMDFD